MSSTARTTPRMLRQRVLPDGGCCFRSVATSFVHALTGRNLGGGAPEGAPMTLKDGAANRASEWVRLLATRALDDDAQAPSAATKLENGLSMLDVVLRCEAMLAKHGETRALSVEDARRMREAWSPPSGAGPAREGGESGKENAMLIEPGETIEQYATRMRKPHEWGGETELFVLSTKVLKVPIEVYVGQKRYGCYNEGASTHTVRVVYNGATHFDAVLGDDNTPPLLALK